MKEIRSIQINHRQKFVELAAFGTADIIGFTYDQYSGILVHLQLDLMDINKSRSIKPATTDAITVSKITLCFIYEGEKFDDTSYSIAGMVQVNGKFIYILKSH